MSIKTDINNTMPYKTKKGVINMLKKNNLPEEIMQILKIKHGNILENFMDFLKIKEIIYGITKLF